MEADFELECDLPEKLRELHDAVLTRIDVAWSTRVCEIHFQGAPQTCAGRPFVLRFGGTTNVVVPASQPWGASSSVLEVRFVKPDNFVFLMQSGDEISVCATSEPVLLPAPT